MQDLIKKPKLLTKIKQQDLLIRGIIIAIIIFLMTIPTALVQSTLHERSAYRQQAIQSVTSSWGDSQTFSGPLMLIPYYINKEVIDIKKVVEKKEVVERTEVEKKITAEDGSVMTVPVVVDAPRILSETKEIKTPRMVEEKRYLVLLPEALNMDFAVEDEIRQYGIFPALVYQSQATVNGQFVLPDMNMEMKNFNRFEFSEIELIVGLSDTRAIKQISDLRANEVSAKFEPGSSLKQAVDNGFHSKLGAVDKFTTLDFSFDLNFNGSRSLNFLPWGRKTEVSIHSKWPHPSFVGDTLPKTREISAEGFTATWNIPSLARNYNQVIFLGQTDGIGNGFVTEQSATLSQLSSFTAGVDLFEPVIAYNMVYRAIKYAILFISLTFLTCLIIERTIKRPIHYIQYIIIGLAVSLFYLCLLSLSEHMTFLLSYLIAAAVIVGMITLYIGAIIRDKKKTGMLFLVLSLLYASLYSILKMEDFALLLGTALLVLVTAVLMLVTRRINQGVEEKVD